MNPSNSSSRYSMFFPPIVPSTTPPTTITTSPSTNEKAKPGLLLSAMRAGPSPKSHQQRRSSPLSPSPTKSPRRPATVRSPPGMNSSTNHFTQMTTHYPYNTSIPVQYTSLSPQPYAYVQVPPYYQAGYAPPPQQPPSVPMNVFTPQQQQEQHELQLLQLSQSIARLTQSPTAAQNGLSSAPAPLVIPEPTSTTQRALPTPPASERTASQPTMTPNPRQPSFRPVTSPNFSHSQDEVYLIGHNPPPKSNVIFNEISSQRSPLLVWKAGGKNGQSQANLTSPRVGGSSDSTASLSSPNPSQTNLSYDATRASTASATSSNYRHSASLDPLQTSASPTPISPRPDLASPTSVRFISSLDDATDDDDEDELFGRVDEEQVGEWDNLGAIHDLATTVVLSMAGANPSIYTFADGAGSRMFASLSKQRAGQWSETRLLAFALTSSESEQILRAFEREECSVSMSLVESTPNFTVALQSVPGAFVMLSEPATESSASSTTIAARLDFANFISHLQQGRQSVDSVIQQLTALIMNKTDSPLSPTARTRTPNSPGGILRRKSSRTDAAPLALSTPYNLFESPLYKAQCVEIVERLRDRGVRASICGWEEIPAERPKSYQTKIESLLPSEPLPTLFSVHLRLTRGSDSSTDSLVKLVRHWMPQEPALDYLIQTPRFLRSQPELCEKFAKSNDKPTSSSSSSSSSSNTGLALPTLRPSADSQSEMSESELEKLAIQREMDRIRRWANSANVTVQFQEDLLAKQEAEKRERDELAKREAEAASQAAVLSEQLKQLQADLAEKHAAVASHSAETDMLHSKIKQLELAQSKLIQSTMEQDELRAKTASSRVAQEKADRDLAQRLHREMNSETAVFEETARRNVEKQRALRAAQYGLASKKGGGGGDSNPLSPKSPKAVLSPKSGPNGAVGSDTATTAAAVNPLSQVGFDPSSSSNSTAPVFASPRHADTVALKEEEEKKRRKESRIEARKPTEGEVMHRQEMFTMNQHQMRQLMEGIKDKIGTTVESAHVDEAAVPAGPLARTDLIINSPRSLEEKNSDAPSSPRPFDMLPLAAQRKIQTESLWQAAHLPSMLDDIRRTSIVPGFSDREQQARADKLAIQVEGTEADPILSVQPDGSSASSPAGGLIVPSKTAQLVAYSSGEVYDKLTGVPLEDLEHMSLRERLQRAETRIEEAEYDDMYRRYLQPKYTVTPSVDGLASPKLHRQSSKLGREKSRKGRHASGNKDGLDVLKSIKETSVAGSSVINAPLSPSAAGGLDSSSQFHSPASPSSAYPPSTPSGRSSRHHKKRSSVMDSAGVAAGGNDSGDESDTDGKARRSGKSKSRRKSKLSIDVTSNSRLSVDLTSPITGRRESTSTALTKRSPDDLIYWVDILVSAIDLDNPFLIGKPDPYIEVYRCRQYIWELVASTEIITKTTSGSYLPLLMSVEALCNMQLDRKILFKVWTNNRGTGRTLIGELSISLTQIQENVGSRFKITNTAKMLADPNGYKHSGFLRFHHAELAVNSTKPTLIFPGPNVKNPAQPIFTKLTSCLVRLQLSAEGLTSLSGVFGGLFGKEKPDPYLEVFHLLPDGSWDTSFQQPAVASASGNSGGCLYRTEPSFQTTRPKFPPFILPFHALCYGDVNRLIRIRLKHKSVTLAWAELTLKEMYLAMNKKIPLKSAEDEVAAQTARASSATATPTGALTPGRRSMIANDLSEAKNAGYLILKKVQIFSHLAELPTLCANAGIERRPVKGVSDLPLKQLIQQQAAEMKAEEAKAKRDAAKEEGGVDTPPETEDALLPDEEKTSSSIGDGSAGSSGSVVIPSKISRNAFRGMHHIRSKAAGKFFQSFLPVKENLMRERQLALLMAGHARLGADSLLGKYLLKSEIFDPHLVPFIFTFVS